MISQYARVGEGKKEGKDSYNELKRFKSGKVAMGIKNVRHLIFRVTLAIKNNAFNCMDFIL